MPRIADPNVPNIGNLKPGDLLPIDRPSDHTASNVSIEDLGNYLLSQLDLNYVQTDTTINNHPLTNNIILTSADVSADAKGTAQALLTAHTNASDPHPQYLTLSEAASAGNYVASVNGHIGLVVLTSADVSAEPKIPVGTTNQYYRGDKIFVDLTTGVSACLGNAIHSAPDTAITDLDSIPFSNFEASNLLGKISWSNIKATLKTYFDGLFSPLVGSSSITTVGAVTGTSFNSITGLGSAPPKMNNPISAIGTSTLVSRVDHVHQSDTTKANLISPIFTTPNIADATATSLTFGGDTNLYRSAPNTLKTDDSFIIDGGLTVIGTMTTDRTVLNGYNLTTISTVPNQVLMFAPASVYRTMELTIQGINEIDHMYHTSKMLVMSDGTNVIHTEYGSINIGGVVCSFTVDMNAGNMRVLVNPVSANSTSFSVTALLTKI